MSNTQITTIDQLDGVVATLAYGGKGAYDQTISFHKIGTGKDQGKFFPLGETSFRRRNVECDGPILPHEKVVDGKELGPKRPCLKIVALPDSENMEFFNTIDLTVRAAYEFAKTKLAEAFPEILTFYYNEVMLVPTRAAPEGTPAREVLIVAKNGVIKSLSDYLPATLNPAQLAAITQIGKDKRITEKDCVDTNEDESAPSDATKASPARMKTYKTYVFENLEPRIHAKTKRLYLEMNLRHGTYPNGIRKYRSKDYPYNSAMSDIKQWGIEIPLLVKTDEGGYAQIRGSDWTKDPSFQAIVKDKEHNNFIGTVSFQVDSVMEGGGHVKTWWRASVLKQPESSGMSREDDFGEDIIDAPVGALVSLSGSPSANSSPGLTRKPLGQVKETDGNDEP